MITLTNDTEVGIPKIGNRHKDLANRLNNAANVGAEADTEEETQGKLDSFGDYVLRHFTD